MSTELLRQLIEGIDDLIKPLQSGKSLAITYMKDDKVVTLEEHFSGSGNAQHFVGRTEPVLVPIEEIVGETCWGGKLREPYLAAKKLLAENSQNAGGAAIYGE